MIYKRFLIFYMKNWQSKYSLIIDLTDYSIGDKLKVEERKMGEIFI